MAVAGTLEIQMFANMARLSADMREAKTMVGGAMKNIEGAVGSAKSALGALGIGLGVGYFATLIRGTIDAMDHINDLSKTTTIAVETLSGLQLAAKQSGGDLDSIATSLNKLSQNMGKDAEKFKALGVSAKDPLEAFKQLSDIFIAIKDPQLRAAVAAEALGKSWAGAAPLLSEGSQKIQEMVDKGKDLSGITSENAKRADDFNDKMAELNITMGATRNKIIGDMLPGMTSIATAMSEAAKEGGLLLTVWVGLGGAMANLLGMADAQKVRARLDEINQQLSIARKQWESGTLNPGVSSGLGSFLVPDIKLNPAALTRLRETIDALEKEKAGLMPGETEDQKWDAAFQRQQASLTKIAEARAKAFLDDGKAAKEAAKESERIRKLDIDGWVKYIDALENEWVQGLTELAKIQESEFNSATRETQEFQKTEIASWVAYIDALQDQWVTDLNDNVKIQEEEAKEITEFWKQAARSMQQSMSGLFFDVMQGNLTDLAGNFKRTIDRMVADMLAAKAATALFGPDFGRGDAPIGGFVGTALEWLKDAIPMAGGGDFMVTRPTLFLAGEAGPERATFSKPGSGTGGVTVNNIFQITGQTDRRSQAQIAAAAGEGVNRAMARHT